MPHPTCSKSSQVKSNLHARRLPLEGSGNQLHGLLLYTTRGHICSVLKNVNVQVCASHNRQNASKLEKSSRHEDRAASSVQWPRACHLRKATSISSHIIFARLDFARLWRSHCKTRLIHRWLGSSAMYEASRQHRRKYCVGRVHSMNVKFRAMANSNRLHRVAQPDVAANGGIQHPSYANAECARRDVQKQSMLLARP